MSTLFIHYSVRIHHSSACIQKSYNVRIPCVSLIKVAVAWIRPSRRGIVIVVIANFGDIRMARDNDLVESEYMSQIAPQTDRRRIDDNICVGWFFATVSHNTFCVYYQGWATQSCPTAVLIIHHFCIFLVHGKVVVHKKKPYNFFSY